MGMPFAGAALKLISEATGEDLTGDAYQMMADMLDEDDKEGGRDEGVYNLETPRVVEPVDHGLGGEMNVCQWLEEKLPLFSGLDVVIKSGVEGHL